jgi:hypothetical protein
MTRLNPLLLKWEIRQFQIDRSLPPCPIARFRWRSDALDFLALYQKASMGNLSYDIVEVWEAPS